MSSVVPSANAAPGTTSSASRPTPKPAAQRVLRIDPPLSNSIDAESVRRPSLQHCPRVEDSLRRVLPAVERGHPDLDHQYRDVVAVDAAARGDRAREAALDRFGGGPAAH